MKKLLLPLMIATLLAACNGVSIVTGSGKTISSTRSVSGFTSIVFDVPAELSITQGEKEALTIDGEDNLLKYIRTEVQNNQLHIYTEPRNLILNPTKPLTFALNTKELTSITVNGSGKVTAKDLTGKEMSLLLNGSGELTFGSVKATTLHMSINGSANASVETLSVEELEANANGSGAYHLNGSATRQNIHVIGSGKYEAPNLHSQQIDLSINGSGQSQVQATDLLNITIIGSGSVTYSGKPKITQQIMGSGSINSAE